jgi:ArsR family transcriptional regulator
VAAHRLERAQTAPLALIHPGEYIAAMAALTTADVLDVLADESRRRILVLLDAHDLCVCELVNALGLPQPTVSRHLMVMRDAGVVEQRKEGRFSFYRIDPDLPAWARRMLDALRDGAAREATYRGDRRKLTLIAERSPA